MKMKIFVDIWIILSVQLLGSTSENLAFRKPAKMSSIYDTDCGPDFAIDGNLSTYMYSSCSRTDLNDPAPWLIVDLLNTFNINRINITNIEDKDHLHSFVIEIFKTNPTRHEDAESEICYNHTGAPVGSGETRSFLCIPSLTGRFVRIKKWKVNTYNDILTICEVEVFGERLTGCGTKLNFGRSRGCRMMSNGSEMFDEYDVNVCFIKCIKHGECLEFNFNEKDHKCELITHPRFEDLVQQDSLWDNYSPY